MSDPNQSIYPLAIRVLHWLMATIILSLIVVGVYMEGLADDAANKYAFYPWHKSFGVLVIILLVIRIGFRLGIAIPPLPETINKWEKTLAHLVHGGIYLLMAAVPISGYVMSGSYEKSSGIDFFGLKLPDLVPKNEALFDIAHELHEILPFLLLALVILHIAGAIKHRFFDNEQSDVLPRMLGKKKS